MDKDNQRAYQSRADACKQKADEIGRKLSKSVANSSESGIIREQSKRPITKITDDAIKRVPCAEIDGYTAEQCIEIQKQHQELLKWSKDKNACNETAFVFRRNLTDRSEFVGDDDNLDFGSEGFNKGGGLLVMHNHPRNSSYSTTDLLFFVDNREIRTLTIVKNNGGVEYITKIDSFDSIKFKLEFDRLYRKIVLTGTDAEKNKFVRALLTKNKSGVIWSGKK